MLRILRRGSPWLGLILLAGCSAQERSGGASSSDAIWEAATPATNLIREGENHFADLRQLTFGGENAEAYWSPDGTSLVLQSTRPGQGCDQIYLYTPENVAVGGELISSGEGRTTCAYFVGPDRVLYASTHLDSPDCPPPAGRSRGYVWPIYESYDIFIRDLAAGSELERLTDTPGYDAEATLSPDGSTIVFTSVRDGDLDIYTMSVDGTDVRRLTEETGYDGGPFFSPDGQWICYRAYHPADIEEINDYRGLLQRHLVRPGKMNLWIMRRDGSERRQVTSLPGASFAPYFTPDGGRLIFASNQEDPRGPFFDLYLVNLDGTGLEKVTTEESFDAFPMFSPDGKYLAFSSNRGAVETGETNVFLARWRE